MGRTGKDAPASAAIHSLKADLRKPVLARRSALVVAAFALQVLPELPMSETDQRVDLVITEDAEYHVPGEK